MTTTHDPATRFEHAAIEADKTIPAIHIWRDFAATPAQLLRAHIDPEVFARWIGPTDLGARIEEWDARDGGSWRYTATGREGFETRFRGCFHTVREDRIVQTFTWEGMPDDVALETLTFEDLGDGRTRLHALSLCDSFEGRDAWLSSGMEVGIDDGYAAIDRMLAEGDL
ncbi:SRPBCC domain-containing protein [Nocardioides piscis]|uniref:Polyketide cyclase n=1 Tax=Nocardioides piscis TaxID=2714938 RepID=A0A6G7YEU0_9ACTN|nr:SRPBCC domain-containing protein [Nocardioides piscis]QIK75414.1 polyketide cyclase [Nocardioides piscis]